MFRSWGYGDLWLVHNVLIFVVVQFRFPLEYIDLSFDLIRVLVSTVACYVAFLATNVTAELLLVLRLFLVVLSWSFAFVDVVKMHRFRTVSSIGSGGPGDIASLFSHVGVRALGLLTWSLILVSLVAHSLREELFF